MESADGAKSPLAMLIKRLQESLSRMESFEVLTAFYGLPGDGASAFLFFLSRFELVSMLAHTLLQTPSATRPRCSPGSFALNS